MVRLQREVDRLEIGPAELVGQRLEDLHANLAVGVADEWFQQRHCPWVLHPAEDFRGLHLQRGVGVLLDLPGDQLQRSGVVPVLQGLQRPFAAFDVVRRGEFVLRPVGRPIGFELALVFQPAGVCQPEHPQRVVVARGHDHRFVRDDLHERDDPADVVLDRAWLDAAVAGPVLDGGVTAAGEEPVRVVGQHRGHDVFVVVPPALVLRLQAASRERAEQLVIGPG